MRCLDSSETKRIFNFLLITLTLSLFSLRISGQGQTYCLTEPGGNSVGNCYSSGALNEAGPFFLKIYIHVIRKTDKTGGQTPDQVREAISFLDAAFNNPHNIFFVWDCDIDFIDNDYYFNEPYGTDEVFNVNNNNNGIDIYLFPDHPFPGATGRGLAEGTVSTAFYVAGNFWVSPYESLVKSYVIAHEMGHCLGLEHTFFYSTTEQLVNDLECDNEETYTPNGDFICDTPADPGMNFNVDPGTCLWNSNQADENQVPYNPDEKNIMAYSHIDCMAYFSEGQGQCMRNLIASEPLLQDCIYPFNYSNPEISSVTTWPAGEYKISGTLSIEPGASLTISTGATVKFEQHASLIIKPNATLYLEGTLTSFCEKSWKGVEVWGNAFESQYPINGEYFQGRFIGRPGALVENAEIGVQLWGPDQSFSGGQLICHGTNFKNNVIGILTAPYENTWPYPVPPDSQGQPRNYFGSLSNCIFVTDNNYPHEDQFYAFIDLIGINGFRLFGCSLENKRELTDCANIADYGHGIFAANAGFSILPKCIGNTYPCMDYEPTTFKGLGYGIHAQTFTENRPFIVKQSNFEDCFVGIHNRSVNGSTILHNNFKMGNLPNTSCTGDQIGVSMEWMINGITFEENEFISEGGSAEHTIGTSSTSLWDYSNTIRRNEYENLSYGNIAGGQNASIVEGEIRGLNYECNVNTNIKEYDFIVTEIPGFVFNNIRKRQGLFISEIEPVAAAGNKFSYSGSPIDSDFRNEGSPSEVEYFYFQAGQNEEPLEFFDIEKVVAQKNLCPVSYCEPPCMEQTEVEQIKQRFHQHKASYLSAYEDYLGVVNSGNQQLKEQKRLELGYSRQEMDRSAYMVALHIMYDTLTFSRDSLRTWWLNMDSYSSDLSLAGDYWSTNQFNEALDILNNAPAKYNLTTDQQVDLGYTISIYDLIRQKTLFGLEEEDFDDLKMIADGLSGYASGLARGLMELYQVEHYPPVYAFPSESVNPRNNNSDYEGKLQKESQGWSIHPNPAGNYVIFTTDSLPETAHLLLHNSSGQLIRERKILAGSKSFLLNTEFLPSGVYFYRLVTNGKIDQQGKLFLQKL